MERASTSPASANQRSPFVILRPAKLTYFVEFTLSKPSKTQSFSNVEAKGFKTKTVNLKRIVIKFEAVAALASISHNQTALPVCGTCVKAHQWEAVVPKPVR